MFGERAGFLVYFVPQNLSWFPNTKTMNLFHLFVFLVILYLNEAQPDFHYEAKFDGIPAAFGDFNSDKFTDIFVIHTDGLSFTVLKGDKRSPYLYEEKSLRCNVDTSKRIVGLILGDFRGKALMDVVVIVTEISKPELFYLYLVRGNKSSLDCSALRSDAFAQVKHQPLLMDVNGDMMGDLFAEDMDGKRYYWLGRENGNFTKILFPGDAEGNTLKNPSSNAFIDIDGNMVPDLITTGHDKIEYWHGPLQLHNATEKVPINVPYPHGYKVFGESTFVDVNADGKIDHLMPVCIDMDCKNWTIVLYATIKWYPLFPSSHETENSTAPLSFFRPNDVKNFVVPLKLREADVDGDGFPDLIGLFKQGNEVGVYILQNVPDENSHCLRSFKVAWHISPILPENTLPVLSTFFDLKEDGRADVLTVGKNSDGSMMMTFVLNTQMIDACFLKVLVTSGLCYNRCPPSDTDGDTESTSISFGTNQAGPLIVYELVDTEGRKRKGAAGQLSQSADFALQMPYSIFGLGQQPNFVDNLTASIPSGSKRIRKQSWPQIIPDSQVVVIPYPPDVPSQWRSRLFITPSDIVISTLITLTSICCLLVVIIAVLHRKEALEDLEEHEEYKRHWPESR